MKKHKDKYNFSLLFLVNRGECEIFKPCWKADPVYAKALVSAQQSGISLFAVKIKWTLYGCYFEKEIKIDLEKWTNNSIENSLKDLKKNCLYGVLFHNSNIVLRDLYIRFYSWTKEAICLSNKFLHFCIFTII